MKIILRGWNGEAMEYGGFSVHASSGEIIPTSLSRLKKDSPVMQWTGLKDNISILIYEDDILQDGDGNFSQVVFEDSAWRKKYVDWDKDILRPILDQKDIEMLELRVVGNCHQHKELLDD